MSTHITKHYASTIEEAWDDLRIRGHAFLVTAYLHRINTLNRTDYWPTIILLANDARCATDTGKITAADLDELAPDSPLRAKLTPLLRPDG